MSGENEQIVIRGPMARVVVTVATALILAGLGGALNANVSLAQQKDKIEKLEAAEKERKKDRERLIRVEQKVESNADDIKEVKQDTKEILKELRKGTR